jgi:steroid 5-alpha reductase family enzyme
MSALELNLWILAGTCAGTWLLSLPTKDTSWVDRIWSIVPIVYAWVWAGGSDFTDARLNTMALLITLWGARLTFNFARKGGYQPGGEDYRWEILRKGMAPWQYQLFNIGFIVIIQNVILFLITTPMYALSQIDVPFGVVDIALAVLFLALLTVETIADQQQWNFHQAKNRGEKTGFLTTGLFAVSRHPNFFAEQSQWWVIFLFSAVQVGFNAYNWIGALVLTALFIGSTRFTEQISLSKYPDYASYQERVSAVIPWFTRKA